MTVQGNKKFMRMWKSRLHRDPTKIYLQPERDWGRIILVFFVLFVAVMGWSFKVFIGIYSGDVFVTEVKGVESDIQLEAVSKIKHDLSAVIKYYEGKQDTLNALMETSGTQPVDPSIQKWKEVSGATETSGTESGH